jgi:hypothetical protein
VVADIVDMGSFVASLKTIGDTKGLPAVVHLAEGRLSINAGDETIGEWALEDIRLEPMETGYRMAAEGEQIILEMTDADGFESELQKNGKRTFALPAAGTLLAPVDKSIALAENKLGALLPEWAFNRVMVAVVVGALLFMIIFPGLVSALLLVAGLLTVMFGAVVYTDPMLASKWLPGRMTPLHVLITGLVVLIFGVLLGVIAK